MHKCPKCGNPTEHRIHQGFLTKTFLPFLKIKRYSCSRCLRKFNVIDKKEAHVSFTRALQSSALESVYLICWMHCIPITTFAGNKRNESFIYLITGLSKNGFKEILGLWINQKAADAFWPQAISSIRGRGIENILIASADFSEIARREFAKYFPESMLLHSFNRQITNSLKHISSKQKNDFTRDMKAIYQAPNKETAVQCLKNFSDRWKKDYGFIVTGWEKNWPELNKYFNYSEKIRSLILLEDMLKTIDLTVDRLYKTPQHRPEEQILLKEMELSIHEIQEKNSSPIKEWGKLMNDFELKFGELWGF